VPFAPSLDLGRKSPARLLLAGALSSALGVGCGGTQAATAPSIAPKTPTSVTIEHPGGDADDPLRSALTRLSEQPWGEQRDRWNTLRVPLADAAKWRRVYFFGYPLRAAYRYGDEHHAVTIVWYRHFDGATDTRTCMEHFLEYALPIARAYGVAFDPPRLETQKGPAGGDKSRDLFVARIDAKAAGFFEEKAYAGAIVAYPSFASTCLVQGFAAVESEGSDLAHRARDRWLSEGAAKLAWTPRIHEAPAPADR